MDPLDFKPMGKRDRQEILNYLRSRIQEADPRSLRQAMLSLGWVEDVDELAQPLMLLVAEGRPEVALAALEGLSQLGLRQTEEPLARHIVEMFKATDPVYAEVRAECIRVLGKVGTRNSVAFLAELVHGVKPATAQDREAAVEALVSLAERRVQDVTAVLEELSRRVRDKLIGKAIRCALKELNLQKWEQQGYLTIEADLETRED